MSDDRVYASAEAVHDFAERLLRANGVPPADAAIVARCLVRADLRGVDTHGVVRLPGYLDRVRRGLINAVPNIAVTRVTPVAAKVDGDNGFGFVVATRAMDEAVAMAREL
jgi:LDH2 family malate/lactate/ureidoglycolate dehydrogenase